MDDYHGNPRRKNKITNRHHYEVEIFNTVLDMQIHEFGDRFSEITTELIENMGALSPNDSFSKFDVPNLVKFANFYPNDFTSFERGRLVTELNVYYHTLKKEASFANLNGITDLARVMVKNGKHESYPLVYGLLKLALVLPVATATSERCFSKLKLVKSDSRNRIGNEFLNNALICAIEKEKTTNVTDKDVIERFHALQERKGKYV